MSIQITAAVGMPLSGGTLIGPFSATGTAATDLPTCGAEFLGASGWTSADWTGDWATGWAHTPGNVSVLSHSTAAVNATKYQIAYTVTGRTAGSFTVAFGGQSLASITATGAFGPTATSTAALTITPTTDFNGTIVVSIRAITAGSTALWAMRDSAGTIRNELRVGAANATAIGVNAGYSNTTGTLTAVGHSAGLSNTTGTLTAVGHAAGYANTTGNLTAVGYQAGRFLADGTTGNATSSGNLYLGAYTRAGAASSANEIVIGDNAIGLGSNSVVLGNSSVALTALRGNVGIGTEAPTAALDLPASTTARASLRIRAMTAAPTALNAGDIWNDAGVLKFYDGTTTKEIAFV
jgi:hypothetical protein